MLLVKRCQEIEGASCWVATLQLDFLQVVKGDSVQCLVFIMRKTQLTAMCLYCGSFGLLCLLLRKYNRSEEMTHSTIEGTLKFYHMRAGRCHEQE